jgi:hypothetical protein
MGFEPDKILDTIQNLLEAAGIHPPLWLIRTITWLVLLGVFLCALWGFLYVLSKIKELASEFVPPRLNREARRRLARRRRFAEHIENEVRRLNGEQSWSDYRFAELEAEVEAEGQRRALPFLPLLRLRTTSGLRREKSLAKAIDVSREKLILIEGDPGSGKSVALRHVVMKLASRARRRGLRTVIPLYINLKEIDRPPDRVVDRSFVEELILKALNRINDRDVEEFLEKEFGEGLQEGTWFFLFDSFDEIPEILGSTEPDTVIREYTRAIEDFLHGLNRCRGVVASRYFRGPGQVQWPRFRILPLSEKRREELVRRADLPREVERELLGKLPLAARQIGDQGKNPLFLSLICEHMKSGRPFPESGHEVFESYIGQRLTRDSERLRRRYGLDVATVREIAERVAFSMTAEPALGLSPVRERIAQAMLRQGLEAPLILSTCMDALEFIKLARAESNPEGGDKLFTFAHRRFQEYFATCLVLGAPERVSPRSLLLDGRWRETAIVICHTAPHRALTLLLDEMQIYFESLAWDDQRESASQQICEFPWPPGSLHVLGILQDGFAGRKEMLPSSLTIQAGRIVAAATRTGTLGDRKWALEVGGGVEPNVFTSMMQGAFASGSRWLAEVAYRQAGQLREITPEVRAGILAEVVNLFVAHRIWRVRHSTLVHLSRIEQANEFLLSCYLLLALPFVDLSSHAVLAVYWGVVIMGGDPRHSGSAALVCLLISSFFLAYPQKLLRVSLRLWLALTLALISLLSLNPRVGLSIFTVLALVWAPAALQVAREGLLKHALWLPAVPLLPVWGKVSRWSEAASRWSREELGEVLEEEPGELITGLLYILIVGFVVSGLVFLVHRSFPLVRSWPLWARVGSVLGPVLGGIFVLCLILWIIAIAIRAWISVTDFFAFRREGMNARSGLKSEKFLEAVERLRSYKHRARFVRTVRRESLLIYSLEAEDRVAKFALQEERGSTARKKTFADYLYNLVTSLDEKDLARRKEETADYLDELYRLREVLRAEAIGAPLPPDKIEGAA